LLNVTYLVPSIESGSTMLLTYDPFVVARLLSDYWRMRCPSDLTTGIVNHCEAISWSGTLDTFLHTLKTCNGSFDRLVLSMYESSENLLASPCKLLDMSECIGLNDRMLDAFRGLKIHPLITAPGHECQCTIQIKIHTSGLLIIRPSF